MASILGSDNAVTGGVIYSTPAHSLGGFSFSAVNGGFNFDLPLATVAMFNDTALSFVAQNSNTNRTFVSNATTTAQAISNSSQSKLFSFLESGISKLDSRAGQALDLGYQTALNAQQTNLLLAETNVQNTKEANSGWCFITTAICELDGLPDDCETLQTFRKFRDEFMQPDSIRSKLVEEYYRDAPAICEALAKMPDKGKQAFMILKNQYLVYAYQRIKKGDNQGALDIYVDMFLAAKRLSQGVNYD